jgi:hypothetical protein
MKSCFRENVYESNCQELHQTSSYQD